MNIIVLLKNNQGSQDVKPILRGKSIKIFGDQVLVFQDEKIYVHNGPEMGIDDFPLLSEFPCDFESIENIEYLKTKSEWHMYRITGTKNIEEVNEESTSITSSITLCVNEDSPELSYSTTSKRFLMGGNGFTVDTTNGVIIALTRGNTVRIPYSEIHGMKKEGNGEEYFVFNQD